ncbi:neuroligin-4, X-linked-like [Mercenaria mercenaria]|uniref:neuroligin-4, X-linked-like n=1 Tax=Mercenaria mercenaria TaxID=6596 RepID=UPI00234EC20A|nr:neuroligin-4, X-linked-like [Mercenaria mercenaria]
MVHSFFRMNEQRTIECLKFLPVFTVFTVAMIMILEAESLELSVATKLGRVVGVNGTVEFNGETKSLTRFLGIPYAKPPTGDKRFQRPEPYGNYTQTYDATYFRPHCMQSELANPSVKYFGMSEDCLHLNIFLPGNALPSENKYAVMIFIHGGSFTHSGAEVFSGDKLSAFFDVIVIKWVHDNIANFAGDRENVTLFGNSAGAASVVYQALNPTNKGLFQRIITQSGSALAIWAQQYNSSEMFADFVSEVNCSVERNVYEDILTRLQLKAAEELVTDRFGPVVDGSFITEDPLVTFSRVMVDSSSPLSLFTEVDFLSGVQSKDGLSVLDRMFPFDISRGVGRNVFKDIFIPEMLFHVYGRAVPQALVQSIIYQYTDWSRPDDTKIIRDKMLDISSDFAFFVPAINTIKKHQVLGKPGKTSYFYVFEHKPPLMPAPYWLQSATHAMELPYVFGLPDSMKVAAGYPPDLQLVLPPLELQLSSIIMTMWTNFAKTG